MDKRLVRQRGDGLITSAIVGMCYTFLPECCEDPECPSGKAYRDVPEPEEGDSEDDETDSSDDSDDDDDDDDD